MKSLLRLGLAVAASYLLAGAVLLLYLAWPDYGGHADVPFSGFPGLLVYAPVAPWFFVMDAADGAPHRPGAAAVFAGVFVAALAYGIRRACRAGPVRS